MLSVPDAQRSTISVLRILNLTNLLARSKRNLRLCHAYFTEPVLLSFIRRKLNNKNSRNATCLVIINIMSKTLHELLVSVINIQPAPRIATNGLILNNTRNNSLRLSAANNFKDPDFFVSAIRSGNSIVVDLDAVPSDISKLLLEAIEISAVIAQAIVNALSLEKTLSISNLVRNLLRDLCHNSFETLPDCVLSSCRKLKRLSARRDLKLSDIKLNNKIRMKNRLQIVN